MTCEGVTKLVVMEILVCQPSSGIWKGLNKKHNLKIILVILVSWYYFCNIHTKHKSMIQKFRFPWNLKNIPMKQSLNITLFGSKLILCYLIFWCWYFSIHYIFCSLCILISFISHTCFFFYGRMIAGNLHPHYFHHWVPC